MCPSFETYAWFPVVQYEAERDCGSSEAAAATAFWSPATLVMSPFEWNTAIIGGNSPLPKSLSVFWFVS